MKLDNSLPVGIWCSAANDDRTPLAELARSVGKAFTMEENSPAREDGMLPRDLMLLSTADARLPRLKGKAGVPSLPHLVIEPVVSHVLPDEQQKPLLQLTELSPHTVSGPMEMSNALVAKAKASGRKKVEGRIFRRRYCVMKLLVLVKNRSREVGLKRVMEGMLYGVVLRMK